MKRVDRSPGTSPSTSPQLKKQRIPSPPPIPPTSSNHSSATASAAASLPGRAANGQTDARMLALAQQNLLQAQALRASSEQLNGNGTGTREVGGGGGDGWTKVDRGKLKKLQKKAQRVEAHPPVFKYLVPGLKNRREPVSIDNVRDFTLSLLADVPAQQWITAENPRSITHVLALFIPGLLASDLLLPSPNPQTPAMPLELPRVPSPSSSTSPSSSQPLPSPAEQEGPKTKTETETERETERETKLPILHTLFSHACPTRAPGETYRMHSFLGQFLNVPVGGEEARKRWQERQLQQSTALTPSDLVLTYPQMKENDYPIPTYLRPHLRGSSPTLPFPSPSSSADPSSSALEPGWIETPPTSSTPARYTLLALDCEMCETTAGQELARVSIVDGGTGETIYDTLVLPSNPITDYQTRWSGVTEAKLRGITTTLQDVQQHLLSILHPETILLGHSLENDLKALKLAHPRVADTSVLFHHPRGGPYKPGLKWLAQRWMAREIQRHDGLEGESGGHDPVEDARAALDLFRLKLEKGAAFGEFQKDVESVFERLARPSGKRPGGATAAVVDHGNPGQWHGAKAKTAVPCSSDEEVVNGVLSVVREHDFVFARMMELSHARGWSTTKHAGQWPMSNVERCSSPPGQADTEAVNRAFKQLNDRLTRLHRSLPKSTAIVLMTGHSDPRAVVALNARKQNWEQQWRKTGDMSKIPKEDWWTMEDDRRLAMEVEKAKAGLAFFCITRQEPVPVLPAPGAFNE